MTSVGKDSQFSVSTSALKHKTSVLGSARVGSTRLGEREISSCSFQTVHEKGSQHGSECISLGISRRIKDIVNLNVLF